MILIIDLNKNKDSLAYPEYVAPIVSIVEKHSSCQTKHISEIKQSDLKLADAVILSGTPLMDNDFQKKADSFRWLADYGKPVLGICAGMQLICLAFGSRLRPIQEIGMINVKTVKVNRLCKESYNGYALHNYAPTLPVNFIALARTSKCLQMIKRKSKEIYGVLFHPEVRNPEIIEKFISIKA